MRPNSGTGTAGPAKIGFPGQELRRAYHFFVRPRVTILIITALLALFMAGLFIPQKGIFTSQAQFEEWNAAHPVLSGVINGLRLNEIYVAPVTIALLALFFLNLVAVMAQRVPQTLRRAYLIDRAGAASAASGVKDDPAAFSIPLDGVPPDQAGAVADRAAGFFRKRLWSVMRSGDGRSFLAVRNRLSPLGFLLFHISFLLCLAGGLLVSYTRFSGNLTLTEGENFHADMTQFRRINDDPKVFRALPELGITLVRVFPSYEGSTATDLNVAVKIQYFSDTFEAKAKVNQPVARGAVSILAENIGVSPLFVLRKGGAEVAGGYFSLNVLKGDEDSFQFPDLPYTVFVKFYPDFDEEAERPATRSLEVKNPVFNLRVERQGKVLFDGLRRPGEGAGFDGLVLVPADIRYWADFLVVREYGTTPLFAGFFLGGAGLVMRLIFYQKTVRVQIETRGDGTVLHVAGRSEYYPETFRENLERLSRELAGFVVASRPEGSAA